MVSNTMVILMDYFPKMTHRELNRIMRQCDQAAALKDISERCESSYATVVRIANRYAKLNGHADYKDMKEAKLNPPQDPVEFQVFEMCSDRADLGDIVDAVGNPAKAISLAGKFAREQGHKTYSEYLESITE